jgi:N-acetylmuramoyl-L-alanine amidase
MPRELKKSDITHLVLHCSDSEWGDEPTISEWHRQRGFDHAGSTFTGYHYLILNGFAHYGTLKDGHRVEAEDGLVQAARPLCYWGCHALGYNDRSFGICLIGTRAFTPKQLAALTSLCRELMLEYGIPAERILGHCETGLAGGKTCPNFSVEAFRHTLAAPKES